MKRIVIANFYPVWPVIGGGQRRIFYLARELSKDFDVEIVSPERGNTGGTTVFGHRFRETRVAVGPRFRAMEIALDNNVKMAADVAYALHWEECGLYQDMLARRLAKADVAITTHPYSIGPILAARDGRDVPVVFDSQNVEIRQKADVLKGFPDLLDAVGRTERTALEQARLTIACSTSDAETFGTAYGIDPGQVVIIENGVDALGVPQVPAEVRAQLRDRLGVSSRLVALFGGSFHHPNFRAVDRILDMAAQAPEVVFLLLGTVCRYEALAKAQAPNVVRLGEVDESTKWMAFATADVGLNPMELGSGSNVKMFEYAAAGLAVVSTPFGARGVPLDPQTECLVAEVDAIPALLRTLAAGSRADLAAIGQRARSKVLDRADWAVIGRRYRQAIGRLTG